MHEFSFLDRFDREKIEEKMKIDREKKLNKICKSAPILLRSRSRKKREKNEENENENRFEGGEKKLRDTVCFLKEKSRSTRETKERRSQNGNRFKGRKS